MVTMIFPSWMIVIDQAILDAIEQYLFSSIQELVRLTCIPTTTVHRQLTQIT
jgi:DNA-binding IclR family transcriptional regulator